MSHALLWRRGSWTKRSVQKCVRQIEGGDRKQHGSEEKGEEKGNGLRRQRHGLQLQ